jgi:hypothetical protein
MSWSDEAFGVNSLRPEDPEFWKVIGIINKLDGRVMEARTQEEKDEAFRSAFVGLPSQTVLAYVAFQRAIRALGITTRDEVRANVQTVMRMQALWVEAFAIGADYKGEMSE